MGTPSRTTLQALQRLAAAGWRIAARADFDGGGLALVRAVLTAVPHARPWRMTASDYIAALHPAPFEPDSLDPDRLGDTPWAPLLATVMRDTGRPAYEEALIEDLLADLRCGSPPPGKPGRTHPAARPAAASAKVPPPATPVTSPCTPATLRPAAHAQARRCNCCSSKRHLSTAS
ncbi:DUF2399 domain-containing protein [Streptomyces sp. NPDC016845]|uniref:DUF2399 domain-containing protein n=1 Tax=Streptomyces sp. NPDC016845 TaxID=3364972 RepID=UPI0037B682FB